MLTIIRSLTVQSMLLPGVPARKAALMPKHAPVNTAKGALANVGAVVVARPRSKTAPIKRRRETANAPLVSEEKIWGTDSAGYFSLRRINDDKEPEDH